MKKGVVYEGVVESLSFPNKITIRVEGEEKLIHSKNGIVGQKVSVRATKVRRDKAEGRVMEVLVPAPNEITPSCPHFAICGGCTYQNLSYEDQLEMKNSQVKSIMDEVIREPYIYEGIKASPVRKEYRNKMEFSFGDEYKGGPLALGMHRRGNFYDIVTVPECELIDSDYRKILTATLQYFQSTGDVFFHKMSHEGFLRHLLVRKGTKTGEILIDLVTSSQGSLVQDAWKNLLLSLELEGEIVGILHTLNDSMSDVVKDEGTTIIYGRSYFYEELLGDRKSVV